MAHRKRVASGLLLGTIVAALMVYWVGNRALSLGKETRAKRVTVVTLLALADAVTAAGPEGPAAAAAIDQWKDHPFVRHVRVANTDNRSIEASTFPADLENGEPPRRMVRDEKPIYDLAESLRAAVESNIDEAAARKNEIATETTAAGIILASAPISVDGEIVAMVQIEAAPAVEEMLFPVLPLVALVVAPVILFLLVSFPLGERKWLLVGTAALLLVAALAVATRWTSNIIVDAARGQAARIAEQMREENTRVVAAIEAARKAAAAPAVEEDIEEGESVEPTVPAPPLAIDPSRWDSDIQRTPLGIILADGSIDEEKIAARLSSQRDSIVKAGWAVGVLALLAYLFVAAGVLASTWATLKRHREAYAYVAPAMFGMILLVFFPFFYGIILSFTDQTIYNVNEPISEIWSGLKNYGEILFDFDIWSTTGDGTVVFNYKNFYWTLFITVAWTVVNVSIGVTLGLFLALILNTRGLAFKPIYRVLLILPWAVPNYITALIWRGMFHQQFGVINQVIQAFGGEPVSWFNNTLTSFTAVVATNGWLSFPFMMVVSLGALQSIPADLYEAARVDGASRWQQFSMITLPSLKPALVPAVILSVVWTFNMFNIIYLVSAGEPAGSTEILITQAYKIAFEQYRYGYAAAYSTVIFGILLVYGTWQNRVTQATEGV
jgi:arabinogalactan oligomer / maltooligosaccharide transport system permease protein